MERTDKSVDDHLAGLEGDHGEDMRLLDAEFSRRTAGHPRHLYEGKFWGGSDQQIIGYGIMDYQNRSGDDVEWFLVGLAAQKRHISVYVNAVKDGAYLLAEYEGRLGKAKVGSAAVSFNSVDDVELDVLLELVEEAAKTG